MTQTSTQATDLRDKYGAEAFEAGLQFQPKEFERRIALRDSLDQYFTKLRLDFATLGMYSRAVLDLRTRFLVLIGQFTMVKNGQALEDTIRGAIAAKVPPKDILEIILQCVIYGGDNAVDPALDIFGRVAEECGLLAELRASQLPLDGHDRERSLDQERASWIHEDTNDPRREALMAKHGWLAVSTGMRLRPKHHLDVLEYFDRLDEHFTNIWVKFCYQGMYTRGVIDDKTRLLCMVGDCMAIGEAVQGRSHMRGAMRAGATPREVMEVILLSCINFGMPAIVQGLKIFVTLMAEQGRLDEIGDPPGPVE